MHDADLMRIERRMCSPTVLPIPTTRNVDSLQHKQQQTATSKPTTLTTPTPSTGNSQQACSRLMPVSPCKSTCKPVLSVSSCKLMLSVLSEPMSSCIKVNVFSHSPSRPPNLLYSSFSCKYPLLG